MSKVCFYFELHQPYRLEKTTVFDIGNSVDYFEDRGQEINRVVFQKVARKSYVPMLKLLKKLVYQYPEFKFAFSASGIFLEQSQKFAPIIITLLKSLIKSGQVEILAETYYHSLASLYSQEEFVYQVKEHEELVKKLFNVTPKVFRNTELIYSDNIGQMVEDLGYIGTLTEAVDRYLFDRSKTQIFAANTKKKMPLLLKHAQLSDDVAFRFSDKSWAMYPLTADSYLDWVQIYDENEFVNLFMDFETFGEHQWEDTGVFKFFADFVAKFSQNSWNKFVTPSEVFSELKIDADENLEKHPRNFLPVYGVAEPISWADVDRDLTAWRENVLQQDTLRLIYDLRKKVLASKNKQLIKDWRRLQTSDHFYYMCTKWANDGDVHAYFSPYQSPFEAYQRYSIVLADLQERIV